MNPTPSPLHATIAAADPRTAKRPDLDALLAMNEADFVKVATENLYVTRDWNGPFQHPDLIHRTAASLVCLLVETNHRIAARREDPNTSAEQLSRIFGFHSHLLATVESTDRRIFFLSSGHKREAQAWKELASELADIVEDSNLARELDQTKTPFGDTTRAWLERRRIKDPSRMKDAA